MAKRDAYKQAAKSRKNAGAHKDLKKEANKKACRKKEELVVEPTVHITMECGNCPYKVMKPASHEKGSRHSIAYCNRYKEFCDNELNNVCYAGVMIMLKQQLEKDINCLGFGDYAIEA